MLLSPSSFTARGLETAKLTPCTAYHSALAQGFAAGERGFAGLAEGNCIGWALPASCLVLEMHFAVQSILMFYRLMVIPEQNIENFQPKEMETTSAGYTSGFSCNFGFPTESSWGLSLGAGALCSLCGGLCSGVQNYGLLEPPLWFTWI